jgi:uncharacterized protein YxeA
MNFVIIITIIIILFILLIGITISILIYSNNDLNMNDNNNDLNINDNNNNMNYNNDLNNNMNYNNDLNNNMNYNNTPDPIYSLNNKNFQQLGTLSSMDDNNTILPLFGKNIFKDRWIYHTNTDGQLNLKIDIIHSERNCMKDQIGCNMIYNDDIVIIPSYNNKKFKVFLYNYAVPF